MNKPLTLQLKIFLFILIIKTSFTLNIYKSNWENTFNSFNFSEFSKSNFNKINIISDEILNNLENSYKFSVINKKIKKESNLNITFYNTNESIILINSEQNNFDKPKLINNYNNNENNINKLNDYFQNKIIIKFPYNYNNINNNINNNNKKLILPTCIPVNLVLKLINNDKKYIKINNIQTDIYKIYINLNNIKINTIINNNNLKEFITFNKKIKYPLELTKTTSIDFNIVLFPDVIGIEKGNIYFDCVIEGKKYVLIQPIIFEAINNKYNINPIYIFNDEINKKIEYPFKIFNGYDNEIFIEKVNFYPQNIKIKFSEEFSINNVINNNKNLTEKILPKIIKILPNEEKIIFTLNFLIKERGAKEYFLFKIHTNKDNIFLPIFIKIQKKSYKIFPKIFNFGNIQNFNKNEYRTIPMKFKNLNKNDIIIKGIYINKKEEFINFYKINENKEIIIKYNENVNIGFMVIDINKILFLYKNANNKDIYIKKSFYIETDFINNIIDEDNKFIEIKYEFILNNIIDIDCNNNKNNNFIIDINTININKEEKIYPIFTKFFDNFYYSKNKIINNLYAEITIQNNNIKNNIKISFIKNNIIFNENIKNFYLPVNISNNNNNYNNYNYNYLTFIPFQFNIKQLDLCYYKENIFNDFENGIFNKEEEIKIKNLKINCLYNLEYISNFNQKNIEINTGFISIDSIYKKYIKFINNNSKTIKIFFEFLDYEIFNVNKKIFLNNNELYEIDAYDSINLIIIIKENIKIGKNIKILGVNFIENNVIKKINLKFNFDVINTTFQFKPNYFFNFLPKNILFNNNINNSIFCISSLNEKYLEDINYFFNSEKLNKFFNINNNNKIISNNNIYFNLSFKSDFNTYFKRSMKNFKLNFIDFKINHELNHLFNIIQSNSNEIFFNNNFFSKYFKIKFHNYLNSTYYFNSHPIFYLNYNQPFIKIINPTNETILFYPYMIDKNLFDDIFNKSSVNNNNSLFINFTTCFKINENINDKYNKYLLYKIYIDYNQMKYINNDQLFCVEKNFSIIDVLFWNNEYTEIFLNSFGVNHYDSIHLYDKPFVIEKGKEFNLKLNIPFRHSDKNHVLVLKNNYSFLSYINLNSSKTFNYPSIFIDGKLIDNNKMIVFIIDKKYNIISKTLTIQRNEGIIKLYYIQIDNNKKIDLSNNLKKKKTDYIIDFIPDYNLIENNHKIIILTNKIIINIQIKIKFDIKLLTEIHNSNNIYNNKRNIIETFFTILLLHFLLIFFFNFYIIRKKNCNNLFEKSNEINLINLYIKSYTKKKIGKKFFDEIEEEIKKYYEYSNNKKNNNHKNTYYTYNHKKNRKKKEISDDNILNISQFKNEKDINNNNNNDNSIKEKNKNNDNKIIHIKNNILRKKSENLERNKELNINSKINYNNDNNKIISKNSNDNNKKIIIDNLNQNNYEINNTNDTETIIINNDENKNKINNNNNINNINNNINQINYFSEEEHIIKNILSESSGGEEIKYNLKNIFNSNKNMYNNYNNNLKEINEIKESENELEDFDEKIFNFVPFNNDNNDIINNIIIKNPFQNNEEYNNKLHELYDEEEEENEDENYHNNKDYNVNDISNKINNKNKIDDNNNNYID